ncbi:melanocyte-stimulating hormone receptor-like [Montipora foliosa]|uniref:melanocyte-stimulating hormone receptor-like n=1 Tax=Montipora foliosa TaxID=591990 RepID=UPI0035F14B05
MAGVFNQSVFCTAELTVGMNNHLICLAVVNCVLSITAILENSLILIALQKETSLHPPSKVLLCSLAASDLFVGLLQPLFATYLLSLVHQRWQLCHYTFLGCTLMGAALVIVSLLTIATISLDRYIALSLGLRYRQVVTLKRVYVAVIVLWLCPSVSIGFRFYRQIAFEVFEGMIILLCVIVPIYCYTGIFIKLRHHETQVRGNSQVSANDTIPLNITRYRKTVHSAILMQLTLALCYLPFMIGAPFARRKIVMRASPSLYFFMMETFVTLMFFNSSLNPVLYCCKIKEVRRALKDTLRELFCLRNQYAVFFLNSGSRFTLELDTQRVERG